MEHEVEFGNDEGKVTLYCEKHEGFISINYGISMIEFSDKNFLLEHKNFIPNMFNHIPENLIGTNK